MRVSRFPFLGKSVYELFGIGVRGAGDVNGDGFDDVIVGAQFNDDCAAGSDCGAAYIFFGAANLSGTKDTANAGDIDVKFLGKGATDAFGSGDGGTSGAGDVNGDGFDDVIVGAQLNNDGGSNNEGAAYIFFGASNLSGTKDTGNGDEDVRILGKGTTDQLGASGAGIGDFNADGIADFIIGAHYNNDGTGANDAGAAYIFFGATDLSGTFDMGGGVQSANVTFFGKAAIDNFGRAVGGGRLNPGS